MKRFILILSLLLAFGLASAQQETLVFGQSGLPVTLDTGQDGNSLTPAYQMLEPLVFFEKGTANLIPGLATEWSSNEDGTVWTLKLREGVTFHDGTPFNAEAVKFNFDRWNDPANEYRYDKPFVPWTWVFGGFGEDSVLESVDVVDEYTVQLNLRSGVSFIPAMLASSYFGMHSPTAIKEAMADYGTPVYGAVGTGAYQFVEWVDGSQVVMERYEGYWGEPANVGRLVFLGIEDPTVRLAQLKSGAIDIAVNLASDDLAAVESDPNLEVATAESNLNVGYLAFHQANEPFDDVLVRKAVAHAIDKQAIVEAFYAGLGTPATQFLPPSLWGRAEDIEPYGYDPERAKELLAEAGFPDGFETELWYMPVSRPYYPGPQDIATAMAAYLADVGIQAELKTVDWGTYLDQYDDGEYPMYMLGWSADYADPDNFLYTFFGPGSAPDQLGWNNQEVFDLLNQARAATTQEARAELYAQAAKIIHEEAPSLPIAHNSVLNATRTGIEGFYPSPLGSQVFLKYVTKE